MEGRPSSTPVEPKIGVQHLPGLKPESVARVAQFLEFPGTGGRRDQPVLNPIAKRLSYYGG